MGHRGRWLNTFVTDTQTDTPTAAEHWQTYHERRELAVVQPLGSLALVNTQVVDSEQTVWGIPGRWAPLPAGESGLKVVAAAADGIHVDGALVDGEAVVRIPPVNSPKPCAGSAATKTLSPRSTIPAISSACRASSSVG